MGTGTKGTKGQSELKESMGSFEMFVLLMFAAALLVGIAQKIHVPYPIALILGGTAIGFIPYEHTRIFDPNLILVIVLPPLLYYAAFSISFREFKHNFRKILSLALGLVFFTTFVIGILFKWLFPQFPWALAFAFGAIVSPPDAVAATAIIRRFSINTRLMTILEGESLVNDASALVLYRLAIVALLSGTFSFMDASLEFAKTVSGDIAIGFVSGILLQNFSRKYLEPVVGVLFSFTIPYITYISADMMGVSGVLAVVVNGLVGSGILIKHPAPLRRIIGFATWDIFSILLNSFVFILIGLQLRILTKQMSFAQMFSYTKYAVVITFAMIGVRMLWVYARDGFSYLQALRRPHASTVCKYIMREAALVSWSGMRGIVSLAAALALPLTLTDGTPLQGRNEVIFIAFVVILLSLLMPGLTLPFLVKTLRIHHQNEQHQIPTAKKHLLKVAEETVHHAHDSKMINDEELLFLKTSIDLESRVFKSRALESVRTMIIREKRKKLFELWENQELSDQMLRQLEHELDLEETHIARAELK